MNTCSVCSVFIDTKRHNEIIDGGEPMHEVCHRLLHNISVPCKVCGLSIEARHGLIRNVEGEGLCKFHVVCYRCVECGEFTNLKIMQDGTRTLPFCNTCSKCDNCHNNSYQRCEVTIKDDHPTRRFLVVCGVCMGLEEEAVDYDGVPTHYDEDDPGSTWY